MQWKYIKLDLRRNGKPVSTLHLFYMDPGTKTLCGQLICFILEKNKVKQLFTKALDRASTNHALSIKQIALSRVSTVNIIMLEQHFKNYVVHAHFSPSLHSVAFTLRNLFSKTFKVCKNLPSSSKVRLVLVKNLSFHPSLRLSSKYQPNDTRFPYGKSIRNQIG